MKYGWFSLEMKDFNDFRFAQYFPFHDSDRENSRDWKSVNFLTCTTDIWLERYNCKASSFTKMWPTQLFEWKEKWEIQHASSIKCIYICSYLIICTFCILFLTFYHKSLIFLPCFNLTVFTTCLKYIATILPNSLCLFVVCRWKMDSEV